MGEVMNIWYIINFDEIKLGSITIMSLFLCLLSYVSIRFLKSLYHLQISWQHELYFCIVFTIFQLIDLFFVPVPYQRVISLCVMSIFISVLLSISFWRSLLFFCTLGMLFVLVDGLIMNLGVLFSLKVYPPNVQTECIIYSIVIVLELLLSFYLKKQNFYFMEDGYEVNHKRTLYSMLIFAAMLIFRIIKKPLYQNGWVLFLNDVFAVLFYFQIVLMNLQKNSNRYQQEQEIETLKMYNKTLSLCTTNIKNFRNDFDMILQDIGGYIKYGEFESLKKYYQAISEEYKDVKSLSVLNPMVINESAVYNIVSNKYYLAKEQGIEVEMEIMMNFKEVKINTYELGRILGILLDNAIEAARGATEKKIYLYFQMRKGKDFIRIANTYKEEEIDISKIFEKGFSTKAKNHGLGLWEVKQILDKHDNIDLYTHKEKDIFLQDLTIFHV